MAQIFEIIKASWKLLGNRIGFMWTKVTKYWPKFRPRTKNKKLNCLSTQDKQDNSNILIKRNVTEKKNEMESAHS